MDAYRYLVGWLIRDEALRGRLLLDHEPAPDGRCPRCHSSPCGPGIRGCRLWAAAAQAEQQALAARIVPLPRRPTR